MGVVGDQVNRPASTALLATASGARWSQASVHRLIRRLATAAHIPGADTIRPHSLLVTARRYLLGVDDLGHCPADAVTFALAGG